MNPTIAAAIAQGLSALIQIWRENANKPPEWTPTAADWDELLATNTKTADDYKREAAALIGVPWPPNIN